jgi:hypothetical protein
VADLTQELRQDAVLLILWQQLCELLLLLPEKALGRTLHRESIELHVLRDVVATAGIALSAAAAAVDSAADAEAVDVADTSAKMINAKAVALQSLGELVPVLGTIVMATPSRGRGSGRSSPVDDAHATTTAGPNLKSPRSGAAADGRGSEKGEAGARGGEVAHRPGSSRQRATSDAVEEMGGKLLRFLRG